MAVLGAGPSPAADRASGSAEKHQTKPDRVVIIVVDALSREIVDKYGMTNVKNLMRSGVNAPNAYLGHLGSVTVVTHNVITAGMLPKNMGWSSEGYRDAEGALTSMSPNGSPYWFTSDWTKEQMFAVQQHEAYPKLADYLHQARPDSTVVTISPKGYAGYAFGGPSSDHIVTFSGRSYDCDGDGVNNWRGPSGVNVPDYLSSPVCGRWYVDSASSKTYDTYLSPARLYPLDGDRYTIGKDPAHYGGDVWAADAAIAAMDNESDWSGIFVTLPGVDKAAHMWGSVDDPGGPDPMTHLANAAKVADDQVGKIVDHLRDTGELDNTLVVLTADHGSVPGRHFYGLDDGTADRGYNNWYYGEGANGSYNSPQPALQPLVDTGNLAQAYSDSQLSFWLADTSATKTRQAVGIVKRMPGVSAVWVRHGKHYVRSTPVRWDLMPSRAERTWFATHAQELINTEASPSGPDVIGSLVDDTTYSAAGDHGGLQRRSQQIPIVFAYGGVPSRDTRAPVRSVDIMPTVLRRMGIEPISRMDGKAWNLG
ncbi:MAG: alkaline phosphatase family protein [Nocardioides sp.]|uniref:alkaline phosphatase family protein n=1 Tax=Nocardioides sp. TaxID=35761 RepID=UPI0039E654AE